MKDWDTTKVRHGTNSGYRHHQALGQDPCDACYRAKQEYDKERRNQPQQVLQNRLNARAQQKAYGELVRLYPDVYNVLYQKWKTKLEEEGK